MKQLGPNMPGGVLEPSRVATCYLVLLLPPGSVGEPGAGTILVVAPAALLHPRVPSRPAASSMRCSLATPNERRRAGVVADLAGALRAWPPDRWAKLGVEPDQIAQTVIGCWQSGELSGLQLDDPSVEEARSLTRPAMTHVRSQPAAA